MPPATGSIRMYSVAYSKADMVPRLGGRFGIISQLGMGMSDGVFVPCIRYQWIFSQIIQIDPLIGKQSLGSLAHTQCVSLY